ncbi:hypothetical protein RFI_01201 [Reticulomyxa filosa]|uniref:Uncharacterized protein n=1 Tax=Reticulomyxa filosa TaxID=46433 RepID=X6PDX8_RETFI|nr:hypothetical protein RFI_01201 [Reticulomyxa filosa]|eukprot:ETO35862.1 hypothetical protein RFI_01201 [Reticulomyxa filosa]
MLIARKRKIYSILSVKLHQQLTSYFLTFIYFSFVILFYYLITFVLRNPYSLLIKLWDVFSGKLLQTFEGHKGDIKSAYFSYDGCTIVSGSMDGIILIWDVLSGKQLLMLKGHSTLITGVQFSPDNSKIISYSSDKTIRLWDMLSGKQLQVFSGHLHVVWAQFSHNGSKIISYSSDKTVRIWDVSLGKQIQLLEGHTGFVFGTQLSPDGSKLVSCSEDRTIRLWGCDNCKIDDVNETNLVKCIWQGGTQRFGLSMKGSIWKNTNGLTSQQKLLVRQRNGKI